VFNRRKLEWENLAEEAQEGISAVAAAAVAAAVSEENHLDPEKCTRQLVQNAAQNAKCHSSQQKASQSIAKNAI
jgi:hypothetical protein